MKQKVLALLAVSLVAAYWFSDGASSAREPAAGETPERTAISEAMPRRGISAHRGAAKTHPENTLTAFREAVRLGAHQIEFDVRETADGVLVIMHDSKVDRTTNGTGRVDRLSYAQISKLDAGAWKHARYAGERVPTLRETLHVMPDDVWLNVHIKEGPRVAVRAAQILAEENRLHQAFLACTSEAGAAAKAVEPGILIANMDRGLARSFYIGTALEEGSEFIQLRNWRGVPTPEELLPLRRAGTRINYCCVEDAGQLEQLFEVGVDFALVDDLAAAMQVVQRMERTSVAARRDTP